MDHKIWEQSAFFGGEKLEKVLIGRWQVQATGKMSDNVKRIMGRIGLANRGERHSF